MSRPGSRFVSSVVVADRIDEVLTIYRSAITDKPIGYQIKGVSALARIYGWDVILVECRKDTEELKELSLFALLLVAYEQGPKTIGRRTAYADALESSLSNPRLRVNDIELVPA